MNQDQFSSFFEPLDVQRSEQTSQAAASSPWSGRLPASWFAVLVLALAYTLARDAMDGGSSESLIHPPNFDVNINSAESAEISALPRVGKGLATRVVEHRAAIGDFDNIEQLKEVPRIGEKTISRLSDYLTTESK